MEFDKNTKLKVTQDYLCSVSEVNIIKMPIIVDNYLYYCQNIDKNDLQHLIYLKVLNNK